MNIGKLYQRTQTGTWYVKVDGKQKRLSACEKEANRLRDKLVAKNGIQHVNGQKKPTVRDMLTLYLAWYGANRSEGSHYQRIGPFESLCQLFGDTEAVNFSAAKLLKWIETSYSHCGNTRRCDLIKWTITAFNWIERNHGIPSKVRDTDKPTPDQREFYVPYKQWAALLECCPPHVHDIVSFMLYTGARPQEVKALAPRHWVRDRFILKASESKGKKYPRTIFVPDIIKPRVLELVKTNKHYVFTNSRGQRWTQSAVNSAARRIKTKMNMPEFCFYSCRHSFAVERIVQGGQDLAIVAKLMGHRSTDMVYKRYGHLSQQVDLLSNAMNASRA